MKKFITVLVMLTAFALCGCGQTVSDGTTGISAAGKEDELVNMKVEQSGQEPDKKTADSAADETIKKTDEKKAAEPTLSAGKQPVNNGAEGAFADEKTEADTAGDKKTTGENVEAGDNEEAGEVKPGESKTEQTKRPEQDAAKELPEYTVTVFAESRTMYAVNAVNVRKGPATAFERVGGLSRAQEVTVTGQADTGWYEIIYGEAKAYVSGRYLQEERPADEPKQPAGQAQPGDSANNSAGVIMVGDSRFVQMQENVGENSCTWIAGNGKGYEWFRDNAAARVDGCVGKGSKILMNLGVNDPGNLNNYLELVNAKAAEWTAKGAKVYYASVNPVWDNPYVTEEQVTYFNSQMQGGLSGDVHWIDSHSYLGTIGYKLVDGLHYNAETYQNLYAYFMGSF